MNSHLHLHLPSTENNTTKKKCTNKPYVFSLEGRGYKHTQNTQFWHRQGKNVSVVSFIVFQNAQGLTLEKELALEILLQIAENKTLAQKGRTKCNYTGFTGKTSFCRSNM